MVTDWDLKLKSIFWLCYIYVVCNRLLFSGKIPSQRKKKHENRQMQSTSRLTSEQRWNSLVLLFSNSLIIHTIPVMFSFSMCQEAVRRKTTEGSSIEFIAYRIPQEQGDCTVLFTRHQSRKVCRAFSIFWLVIEIFTSKFGVAKI